MNEEHPARSGSCVIYYGIRLTVDGERELHAMELDPGRRLSRVYRAGLQSRWVHCIEAGEVRDYLFIGTQIAAVPPTTALTAADARWDNMRSETQEALRALGYEQPPAFHIQWDPED